MVLVAATVAAMTDLWSFRIHNALTLPLLLTGLAYHGLAYGTVGLALSALGALVGFGLLILVYVKGAMGAGDIKLMAGVGAWLGPWLICHVMIVSGLATGCWSVANAFWKGTRISLWPGRQVAANSIGDANAVGEVNSDVTAVLTRPDRRGRVIPFGAMVALGVIATAFWMGWR